MCGNCLPSLLLWAESGKEADRHRAAGTFIPLQEVQEKGVKVSLDNTPLKCPHTGQVLSKTLRIMAQQSTAQQGLLRGT